MPDKPDFTCRWYRFVPKSQSRSNGPQTVIGSSDPIQLFDVAQQYVQMAENNKSKMRHIEGAESTPKSIQRKITCRSVRYQTPPKWLDQISLSFCASPLLEVGRQLSELLAVLRQSKQCFNCSYNRQYSLHETDETQIHVMLQCNGVAKQRASHLGPSATLHQALGDLGGLLSFWSELA
ncbi:jg19905 [Pararge aegeria aegeria]|uniref:Jg19905 protein n=1 Tax=Pararge aegeria aegeria TaxID=348720 RepID=A0A8S4SM48_9NEOP|nr:jg19905 [Pararge aegeria aegeria]